MKIYTAGDYILRYTATDSCGKSASVDREVTVKEVVYGVEWDLSENSKLTRIESSENFGDPSPAVANGNGSSPFDDIYPWSGIERVTDSLVGEVVRIPQFYYLWEKTDSKISLKISPTAKDGFYESPAFLIGRYLSGDTYKSESGKIPISDSGTNMIHGIANLNRPGCRTLSFWCFLAVWMLYLVEFADFNSQKRIGYGCSSSGSVEQTGSTDNMIYHTGTSAQTREEYGETQYRYIEGLWSNLSAYCDDIRANGKNITQYATVVGTQPSANGIITDLQISEYADYDKNGIASQFVFPITTISSTGNTEKYLCDQYANNNSNNRFSFGGRAYRTQLNGIGRISGASDKNMISDVGCRLIVY